MTNWSEINKEIKKCKQLPNPEDVIKCLLKLYEETEDGWVASNIGEEYEKIGNIDNLRKALEYYEKAEGLLPLPRYKNLVREKINNIRNRIKDETTVFKTSEEKSLEGIDISSLNPSETLFVVPCTKTKIWDIDKLAPDYVPAKNAYRGEYFEKFLEWLENNEIEKEGFNWIILSGKYGFIEPEHPISRYDVYLGGDDSISDTSLKNQIRQKRWWRDRNGKIKEITLENFKYIICVNCSRVYLEKIEKCFTPAKIEKVRI
jgi:hypothetical protein